MRQIHRKRRELTATAHQLAQVIELRSGLAGDFRRPYAGGKVIDFDVGVEAQLVFSPAPGSGPKKRAWRRQRAGGLDPISSGAGGWVPPSTLATAAAFGVPGGEVDTGPLRSAGKTRPCDCSPTVPFGLKQPLVFPLARGGTERSLFDRQCLSALPAEVIRNGLHGRRGQTGAFRLGPCG